jgi:hypothetical protein
MQTADLMPVVITFTATISECEGRAMAAMQKADMMPVVITYTATISACAMDEQGRQHSACWR